MTTPVLIYYDARMLGHNPHGWDPDHPEWTDAVKTMIANFYLGQRHQMAIDDRPIGDKCCSYP